MKILKFLIPDFILLDLYKYIEHGDDNHKQWLNDAIFCWKYNKSKPEQK